MLSISTGKDIIWSSYQIILNINEYIICQERFVLRNFENTQVSINYFEINWVKSCKYVIRSAI